MKTRSETKEYGEKLTFIATDPLDIYLLGVVSTKFPCEHVIISTQSAEEESTCRTELRVDLNDLLECLVRSKVDPRSNFQKNTISRRLDEEEDSA